MVVVRAVVVVVGGVGSGSGCGHLVAAMFVMIVIVSWLRLWYLHWW